MNPVTLQRHHSDDQGTAGVLTVGKLRLHTLELPWADNKPQVSCIPVGRYHCAVRQSPRFGAVYHVQNVPGRSYILIHSGNYAGAKPYKSHVLGCILLGKRAGIMDGQRAVLLSRPAVREFMDLMQGKPFELEIVQ